MNIKIKEISLSDGSVAYDVILSSGGNNIEFNAFDKADADTFRENMAHIIGRYTTNLIMAE